MPKYSINYYDKNKNPQFVNKYKPNKLKTDNVRIPMTHSSRGNRIIYNPVVFRYE